MGCPSLKEIPAVEDDHSQLLGLIRRLRIQFQSDINRLNGEVNKLITRLKGELKKSTISRSRHTELQILEDIVSKQDLKLVYKQVILQCDTIKENKHHLNHLTIKTKTNQPEPAAKKLIMYPFQVILFAMTLIREGNLSQKNADLLKLQNLIHSKYKQVRPIETTRYEIINFYCSFQRPNANMIKEYVFSFCNTEGVALSTFNAIGHNFQY